VSHHDDFAFDPVKGLPEHLPQGEVMLWQGSPHWQSLALRAFHIRKVALRAHNDLHNHVETRGDADRHGFASHAQSSLFEN